MTQKSVEITRKGAQHSFSHPDCDRRYRNFAGSAMRLVDFRQTEFHRIVRQKPLADCDRRWGTSPRLED